MIDRKISDKVLTIGPSPLMKGGIAQVLSTYFTEVFDKPKFIAETTVGSKVKRASTSLLSVFRLVYKLSTDRDIRIVHLHTAHRVSFPRSAFFARIARLFGKKVILHIHGSKFKEYYLKFPKRVKNAVAKADRVVVLSESWNEFFKNVIGVDNTVIVSNIISFPHYERPAVETSEDVVDMLFLGQLGERKGIYDLLEALHLNDISLRGRIKIHVGGNGDIDGFLDKVKEYDLEDMVQFHGWSSGADKISLLNKCSIFILPSYAEGLPISILEAMAYGCAVISTPVGGIPEIVDAENGILVEPGDVEALGKAICELISDGSKTKDMGKVSLTRIESHLPENVETELVSLYQSLLVED